MPRDYSDGKATTKTKPLWWTIHGLAAVGWIRLASLLGSIPSFIASFGAKPAWIESQEFEADSFKVRAAEHVKQTERERTFWGAFVGDVNWDCKSENVLVSSQDVKEKFIEGMLFRSLPMTPFGRNTFIISQKILSFNWSGKHAPRVAQHCLFNWIHKWHCECHKFWQIAEATWKNRGRSSLRKQPLRFAWKDEKNLKIQLRTGMEAWMEAIGTDLDLGRSLVRNWVNVKLFSPSLSGLLEHAQQPNAHERNYV